MGPFILVVPSAFMILDKLLVLVLFVDGERRHDVVDCDSSSIRVKDNEASGEIKFTPPKTHKVVQGGV